MVGDSDAMGVAGQIVKDVFCSAKGGLGLDRAYFALYSP